MLLFAALELRNKKHKKRPNCNLTTASYRITTAFERANGFNPCYLEYFNSF